VVKRKMSNYQRKRATDANPAKPLPIAQAIRLLPPLK